MQVAQRPLIFSMCGLFTLEHKFIASVRNKYNFNTPNYTIIIYLLVQLLLYIKIIFLFLGSNNNDNVFGLYDSD